MKKFVTFGEIMLRLSPPGNQRFAQAASLDVHYGGGEANVAVGLARYGLPTSFVTRVPVNPIGDACLGYLRRFGVDVSSVVYGGSRLGVYFLEVGAAQRGSLVVYDRADSALAEIEPGMVPWSDVFSDAQWLHVTGITPSISRGAAEATIEAARHASEAGVTVSCDLNYRAKLWKWGKTASEVMPDLVECCDYAIGNEEDADKVFGIRASHTDVDAGKIDAREYREVTEALLERFPRLKGAAVTLRTSLGASRNKWSAVYQDRRDFHVANEYDIFPIVDRVGAGDAFCGGLIYGLTTYGDDARRALQFATAAGCLKHSMPGDFNVVTVTEVEKLAGGDASGRVAR